MQAYCTVCDRDLKAGDLHAEVPNAYGRTMRVCLACVKAIKECVLRPVV